MKKRVKSAYSGEKKKQLRNRVICLNAQLVSTKDEVIDYKNKWIIACNLSKYVTNNLCEQKRATARAVDKNIELAKENAKIIEDSKLVSKSWANSIFKLGELTEENNELKNENMHLKALVNKLQETLHRKENKRWWELWKQQA